MGLTAGRAGAFGPGREPLIKNIKNDNFMHNAFFYKKEHAMSEVKQGVAAKLENVFLDILRFVILLVLAVSLVAAAVLGI